MTIDPVRPRRAVAANFFCHGMIIGSWAPHIPFVARELAVSKDVLGLILLGLAAGAVIAMPIAGMLAQRFGSAVILRATSVVYCLSIVPPILGSSIASVTAALIAFGAGTGAMDVAMNTHGVTVEKTLGRPTMSFFHGCFSVGGMAGAGLGIWALSALGEVAHVVSVALIGLGLIALASPHLLPSDSDRGRADGHFALPRLATLGLGALCFVALMIEGAMLDWSAIHLIEAHAIDAHLAGFGFALFSGSMALARFTGDWLRASVGAVRMIRWSAAATAAGLALATLAPSFVLALLGYLLMGLAIGNIAPVLFAKGAEAEPDAPGHGIAAVTTLGYTGFLVGPPLIGFLASATSLTLALLALAIGAALVSLAAPLARRHG